MNIVAGIVLTVSGVISLAIAGVILFLLFLVLKDIWTELSQMDAEGLILGGTMAAIIAVLYLLIIKLPDIMEWAYNKLKE